MTRLVATADADADLDDVLAYLEREAGPRVAENYGRKIAACLAPLVEFPGIGTRRPALGADTRIGVVRPYILIYDYAVATDTLILLRIVHGKRNILCVIEERVVGNDNTVAWSGRRLQLPESRLRPHFVKAKVQVREYPDGELAVDLGPHRLARYGADGQEVPAAPSAGSVLEGVKGWPGSVGARGWGIAAATLDPFCARCQRAAMPESLKGHVERTCP